MTSTTITLRQPVPGGDFELDITGTMAQVRAGSGKKGGEHDLGLWVGAGDRQQCVADGGGAGAVPYMAGVRGNG